MHIIGQPNLATLLVGDAYALYARNVLDAMKLIVGEEAKLVIDRNDEIIAATLMC